MYTGFTNSYTASAGYKLTKNSASILHSTHYVPIMKKSNIKDLSSSGIQAETKLKEPSVSHEKIKHKDEVLNEATDSESSCAELKEIYENDDSNGEDFATNPGADFDVPSNEFNEDPVPESQDGNENSSSDDESTQPPRVEGLKLPQWSKYENPWDFIGTIDLVNGLNDLDPGAFLVAIPDGPKRPSRIPIDCTENYNRFINNKIEDGEYDDDCVNERSTNVYRVRMHGDGCSNLLISALILKQTLLGLTNCYGL